ncbi:hypothetical protein [Dyella sp.]|uniref:hypothetical protein n=1 Tax=Dyella sp. TaxID=1869338 RepID=UPI002ECFC4F5
MRKRWTSPLKARARAIRDELVLLLTLALSQSVGRDSSDAQACLLAHLLVATWAVAFTQAHLAYRRDSDEKGAKAVFLHVVDQGMVGVKAAAVGTPYV